jgi:hypothetical protein
MLARYCVTGWSPRFGVWETEMIEAKNMEAAKVRYSLKFSSNKRVKAYLLRTNAEMME